MFNDEFECKTTFTHDDLIKMKGQAVPLVGLHLIRDHVLSTITGEFESSILYWAGKDLAPLFSPNNVQELTDLFLELGWGYLELEQVNPIMQTYRLYSPFFASRKVENNESTFALECGFLTALIGQMENKNTEGEFKLHKKNEELTVAITVHIEKE